MESVVSTNVVMATNHRQGMGGCEVPRVAAGEGRAVSSGARKRRGEYARFTTGVAATALPGPDCGAISQVRGEESEIHVNSAGLWCRIVLTHHSMGSRTDGIRRWWPVPGHRGAATAGEQRSGEPETGASDAQTRTPTSLARSGRISPDAIRTLIDASSLSATTSPATDVPSLSCASIWRNQRSYNRLLL